MEQYNWENISEDREKEMRTTETRVTVQQGNTDNDGVTMTGQWNSDKVMTSWQWADSARMWMVEWQGDDGEVGCP